MIPDCFAAPHAPPCAQYEEGEGDQRLLAVWTFVSGLVGGGESAARLSAKIARLFDYKGELIVAVRQPIQPNFENFFRYAWREIGGELPENVQFLGVDCAKWEGYWSARRFDSDWKP